MPAVQYQYDLQRLGYDLPQPSYHKRRYDVAPIVARYINCVISVPIWCCSINLKESASHPHSPPTKQRQPDQQGLIRE